MRIAARTAVLMSALLVLISAGNSLPGREGSLDESRNLAHRLFNDGNYREALGVFQRLSLDQKNSGPEAGNDMEMAVSCLQSLNRTNETDDFLESVIQVHQGNWRLLYAAAQSFFNADHYGYIVAGEFQRGQHRGGGHYVNSSERDRVRALQLMTEAMEKTGAENDRAFLADFHLQFASMLMGQRGYSEAWRLQYLSGLSALPDYEEGYGYSYGTDQGAPVDPDGNPVYHHLPKTYREAKSDGERWRWHLERSRQIDPGRSDGVLMSFADFLHQQFGVGTMRSYGFYFRDWSEDQGNGHESRTYELHTLGEDETMARLATGIKRFRIPDEFNFIRIYQTLGDRSGGGYSGQALNKLAQIFEDRRQYDKAAELWKRSIAEDGDGHDRWKGKRVDQILGNWGRFEPVMTHPAGRRASMEYRFRNGRKVSFEAHEIHVKTLLSDVKAYLKSNPRELDWDKMNINTIGFRIVKENEKKYLGDRAAQWDLELEPRSMHFDRRITVTTPLRKAGAYLLTAQMQDGNTSKIVIWIDDTVLVRKQLNNRAYLFAADSVTGKPLERVRVNFFGYRQEATDWSKLAGRRYEVRVKEFSEFTDRDGQVMPQTKDFSTDYSWMIAATTQEGRLAYLGFSSVWYSDYYDHEYNETKVFSITDRPVYRPKQPVRFKFWVRHAKYDQEDTSSFAHGSFAVRIQNPKGEKVYETQIQADAYGGMDGEYLLPEDAALGVYSIQIPNMGGGTFRVEEYKKPEFEVKVEAPTEPVMLGEKITATIRAGYYFGAPVTQAKVKYKVLRSEYRANWYPVGLWDWFYGPGYWWFAYDYAWYPGWEQWGVKRPLGWWWPVSRTPPEVVAETEVEIGEDGTVRVEIDTALAKELHGSTDHRYEITVEVTDRSRRTIVGKGTVLAARKPFKVYTWVDRGHYRTGDVIQAEFLAQTLDNKPVPGQGVLNLYRIRYRDQKPLETPVQKWDLGTDDQGRAHIQIQASEAGQYRLSFTVTDSKNHAIEGGYVFTVMGESPDIKEFRFNEIELVPDKREYAPGDKVRVRINTDQENSTVVLFIRPSNGIYLEPKILNLQGKSAVEEIEVTKKDMPNFFVEAFTIRNGKLYSETREIIVPPEKRVLNLEVMPSSESYKPGEKAKVRVKVTDFFGEPFAGSTVMTVYDKAVEYISGGGNVPEIRAFFWKWRRHHSPRTESSLDRRFQNLVLPKTVAMGYLGVFGHLVADESGDKDFNEFSDRDGVRALGKSAVAMSEGAVPAPAMEMKARQSVAVEESGAEPAAVEPAVRTTFADTAFWTASLTTDEAGMAEVEFDMPENLTGWKIRTWAMGHGTLVGEGTSEVVTAKDLLLRLQAPRFFVEKDEVVLSANIHNYLESEKSVRAVLELEGGCLEPMGEASRTLSVAAGGEERVDWRVKVLREGEAVIRMKALTDQESDAMEMRFPVYVHGMLKTESASGVIREDQKRSSLVMHVPSQRRIDQSRLEIRYSPTLAGAMVDALPYLVGYPYGCTEQTLNRFLPTVITQRVLLEMGLPLKAIQDKRTNLNAQEIGDDPERAKQWKRFPHNPVFDEETVRDMVEQGLRRLTSMQLSDGGWGWFSGWGEKSYPHTTAYVVHGLQIAQQNKTAVDPALLDRGIQWLLQYQAKELGRLKNAELRKEPDKSHADNLDAFVYMVLVDAGREDGEMREFLYRDRNHLAVYGKAMYGMALHKESRTEKLEMILRNIEQYLVEDAENQTAYLNLSNEGSWWYWYGSEYEAHAYYLKLLALTDPKSAKASGLVKYLLNNRKHATYWNSTRDTALCVEAMADYLRASGESRPDMTVEIYLDGQKHKEARITSENLFTFDNALILTGKAIESGKHQVEIRRKGKGPVYFNAYLTNFTLEDFITRAGLEIKVNRKYYRLHQADKTIKVAGSRGQALDQKVEKYEREELANLSAVKSGDLVEIELEMESKNDYEYLVFEDMKAAGFEPVEVRSGYHSDGLGAYMELRDERVVFFVRALARGKHSMAYRMRAEIPGKFSALPTRGYAMYAPELKANSDEIKLLITDEF